MLWIDKGAEVREGHTCTRLAIKAKKGTEEGCQVIWLKNIFILGVVGASVQTKVYGLVLLLLCYMLDKRHCLCLFNRSLAFCLLASFWMCISSLCMIMTTLLKVFCLTMILSMMLGVLMLPWRHQCVVWRRGCRSSCRWSEQWDGNRPRLVSSTVVACFCGCYHVVSAGNEKGCTQRAKK